jgi:putative component of membrane protein insertase Oxa1/YidC/SpoIIIJ protein YidD
MRGVWLVVKRLLRCHPYENLTKQLGPTFGYDPVPELTQKVANKLYSKKTISTKK